MSAEYREKSLADLSRALRAALKGAEDFFADVPGDEYTRGRVSAFKHAVNLFDVWTDGDFEPASTEGGAA